MNPGPRKSAGESVESSINRLNRLMETASYLEELYHLQAKGTNSDFEKKKKREEAAAMNRVIGGMPAIISSFQAEGQDPEDLIGWLEQNAAAIDKSVGGNRDMEDRIFDDILPFFIEQERNPLLEWAKAAIDRIRGGEDRNLELKREARVKVDQRAEVKAKEGDIIEAGRLQEKLLFDTIAEKGRGGVHMSLPAAYQSKEYGYAGYKSVCDEDFTQSDLVDKSTREVYPKLREASANEICVIRPIRTPKFKRAQVQVAKKGLFGIGSREAQFTDEFDGYESITMNEITPSFSADEVAYELIYVAEGNYEDGIYGDYSGRGSMLSLHIALPRSTAQRLAKMIQSDPTLVRRLAKERIRKHITERGKNGGSDFENAWNEGNEITHGNPLRPPYEKWDAKNKRMKMEFHT